MVCLVQARKPNDSIIAMMQDLFNCTSLKLRIANSYDGTFLNTYCICAYRETCIMNEGVIIVQIQVHVLINENVYIYILGVGG